MTRLRRLTVLVVAALGAAAAAYYYIAHRETPPQVATQPITRGDIIQTVGVTGTLEAVTTVQVGTQVSGTVLALLADFNSTVRRGQVIARLDPALFQTQVEQARANVAKAEADLDRLRLSEADAHKKYDQARQLAAKNLIATTDLDSAQATYLTAAAQVRSSEATLTQTRASLQQAQVSLEKTVITSPIDGIVIARNVDVGQTVAASLQAPTLFVIAADLTKMRVNASVHEADVGQILPGQTALFRVDAYPSDEFPGTVSLVRLNPIVQQNVVTYATLIDVPNPTLKLKPGMTATVTIRIAECRDALRVPNAALRFHPTSEMLAVLGQPRPTAGAAAPDAAGRSARGAQAAAGARGVQPGASAPGAEPGAEGTPAEIWTYQEGVIARMRVRLGISDDTYTELIGSDLADGTPVVTSVTLEAAAASAATPSTSNPLMGPQRPGRPGGRQP